MRVLRWLRPVRLVGRTVRLRLTLLYGGLFLASGAVLLAITYGLVSHAGNGSYTYQGPEGAAGRIVGGAGTLAPGPDGAPPAGSAEPPEPTEEQPGNPRDAALLQTAAARQHNDQMHELLVQSATALAIMSVVSVILGWIVAGRVLSRLRTITSTARNISATNLHERLALPGPGDELKELGDTVDDLLARLETSFQSQRQFIANASHELRTPLARQRALSQVALDDPEATVASLRAAHERVLVAGAQQERLIAALLTLARGQAGIEAWEPFDLTRVVHDVVEGRRAEADRQSVAMRAALDTAWTAGDPRLAEQLAVNLVDNAIRHNAPGGWVEVGTATRDGCAVLTVTNVGPVVPESEIQRLFRPFQRLAVERTSRRAGLGLGLSIVQAIAAAHDAVIDVVPRPGGGLRVEVRFGAQPTGAGH